MNQPTARNALTLAMLIAMLLPSLLLAQESESPLAGFTTEWREGAVWDDGKAEVATYRAAREVYGKTRRHTATLYTNTEHASAQTFTKSDNGKGRAVFKHHLRENIPTDAYDYHYSTMVYVGRDDMKSLKLDLGSVEACGATSKQIVNHADQLWWRQYSYFPDQGFRDGTIDSPPADLVFQDALSLVLRGYPFANAPRQIRLRMIPDQTSNKWSTIEPIPVLVMYAGVDTLDLPIGQTPAHHIRIVSELAMTVGKLGHEPTLGQEYNYWFAADPKLHNIMVQYEGPAGISYQLENIKREAYWEKE